MDNPEKRATLDTLDTRRRQSKQKIQKQYVLDTTIPARHKTKTKKKKKTHKTRYVSDTTIHKQTQITQMRHSVLFITINE